MPFPSTRIAYLYLIPSLGPGQGGGPLMQSWATPPLLACVPSSLKPPFYNRYDSSRALPPFREYSLSLSYLLSSLSLAPSHFPRERGPLSDQTLPGLTQRGVTSCVVPLKSRDSSSYKGKPGQNIVKGSTRHSHRPGSRPQVRRPLMKAHRKVYRHAASSETACCCVFTL